MTPTPDIVTIVTQTYRTLWTERFYILRLAAVPFFVIYLNFLVVHLLGDDVSILRRGLYIIPAMIAEAWVVAQFLRTLLTRERWPMSPPTGIDDPAFPARLARARALLAAIIFYVLVSLGSNAMAGVLGHMMPPDPTVASTEPPSPLLGVVFLILLGTLAQFRLLWLYIPLVLGQPLKQFIQATQIWILNIQLVGVWFASVVPVFMAAIVVLKPLLLIQSDIQIVAFVMILVTAALQVVSQLVVALAASTAIAIALSPALFGGQHGRR